MILLDEIKRTMSEACGKCHGMIFPSRPTRSVLKEVPYSSPPKMSLNSKLLNPGWIVIEAKSECKVIVLMLSG